MRNLIHFLLQGPLLLAAYMGVLAALALLVTHPLPYAGLVGGVSLAVIWLAHETEGL